MNLNEQKSFESELRQLRPAKTMPEIREGLLKRIQADQALLRKRKLLALSQWTFLAAAVGLMLAAGVWLIAGGPSSNPSAADPRSPIAETSGEPVFTPVEAENILQERIDEGIFVLQNGVPARRYRYAFVDRVVWKNEADGSFVEMEVPRDEVVYVPIQTF